MVRPEILESLVWEQFGYPKGKRPGCETRLLRGSIRLALEEMSV